MPTRQVFIYSEKRKKKKKRNQYPNNLGSIKKCSPLLNSLHYAALFHYMGQDGPAIK